MQKETLQVALASLVSDPGLVSGWETSITEQLGGLPERFSDTIAMAARLSAGISAPPGNMVRLDSIFNSITLDSKRPPAAERQSYMPEALSLQKGVIFPGKQQGGSDQKTNFEKIVKEIKRSIPDAYRDDESFLEEVLSVLHRTTVNIPDSVGICGHGVHPDMEVETSKLCSQF